MRFPSWCFIGVLLLGASSAFSQEAGQVRLKEIAYIQGVRENQLVGFGLVSGLDGKGDSSQSELLQKVLNNLLASFDIAVSTEDIISKNCAVVIVTSDLPSFVRPGDRINVQISSIGDAKSIGNGILLQTPLKAANGQIYAVAQGMLGKTVGETKTVGSIPGGAIVEREVLSSFLDQNSVSIILRNPDFLTASRVAQSLRLEYPDMRITAVDASLIQVSLPDEVVDDPVPFLAGLEETEVTPDSDGRVVINQRSGIVVVGKNVRIGEVAVTYQNTQIDINQLGSRRRTDEKKEAFVINGVTTVNELVKLLQDVGLKTESVIEILQAIEKAGALYGRLIVM